MKAAENTIAVIIIAAGASSRMGRPKQLLPFNGKPLLQHMLQVSMDSIARPVVVVIGANAGQIISDVDFTSAHLVVNDGWQEGMASSIRCGIKTLIDLYPFVAGAIIMLCDQPYTTSIMLDHLVTTYFNTNKTIVASEYNGVLGAPSFFHKNIFPELLQLKNDVGAKIIMQRHSGEVASVAFIDGHIDIDTPTDYEEFLKSSQLL